MRLVPASGNARQSPDQRLTVGCSYHHVSRRRFACTCNNQQIVREDAQAIMLSSVARSMFDTDGQCDKAYAS